jgi:hypothetical protein
VNFVAILKIVLGLASKLAEYVKNKQLMDAGASEALLKGLRDADDAIARANSARANVDSLPVESDPQNRSRSK